MLCIVIVFGVVGCSGKSAGNDTMNLKKTKALFVSEEKEVINIPGKYKKQLEFLNADDEYLYFGYSKKDDGENPPFHSFRVSRKNGEIIEFPEIQQADFSKHIRGFDGKLYVDRIYAKKAVYKISEISEDGKVETIYKRRVHELPMVMSSGCKEILSTSRIDSNGVASRTLELLDLKTRKVEVIDRARTTPSKKEYGMDGTLFMGFDYPFESASADGFCYEKCKYDGETENTEYGGKNKAYYYSFKTGTKTRLKDPVGTLEYINGTPDVYLSSTFTGGIDANGDETDYDYGEANMFIRKNGRYKKLSLNKILEKEGAEVCSSGTLRCGGMVGGDNVIFRNWDVGFFIINLNTFEYFHGSFQNDDLAAENPVYQDYLGDSYDNTNQKYSFLTKDKTKDGHKYVLHTLSGE